MHAVSTVLALQNGTNRHVCCCTTERKRKMNLAICFEISLALCLRAVVCGERKGSSTRRTTHKKEKERKWVHFFQPRKCWIQQVMLGSTRVALAPRTERADVVGGQSSTCSSSRAGAHTVAEMGEPTAMASCEAVAQRWYC